MNRRLFMLGLAGITHVVHTSRAGRRHQPAVSITLDDFSVSDSPLMSGPDRHRAIMDALKHHGIQAGLMVTGQFVETQQTGPLLEDWCAAGHIVGNHTYSHDAYPASDFDVFTRDVLRNEQLLKPYPGFRKLFRFPYLKEGKTPDQRDRMRRFLKENGYRNAHVSIDASDWLVDARLRARIKNDEKADLGPYRDFYLAHLTERALFYDSLAQRLLGRSIPHVLLLHHNLINGLFLRDVLDRFKQMGWDLVGLESALADPVYTTEPDVTPAGESLLHAMARQKGGFEQELRYPGEDSAYEEPQMDALGL